MTGTIVISKFVLKAQCSFWHDYITSVKILRQNMNPERDKSVCNM